MNPRSSVITATGPDTTVHRITNHATPTRYCCTGARGRLHEPAAYLAAIATLLGHQQLADLLTRLPAYTHNPDPLIAEIVDAATQRHPDPGSAAQFLITDIPHAHLTHDTTCPNSHLNKPPTPVRSTQQNPPPTVRK
jgi:hypothetical protein